MVATSWAARACVLAVALGAGACKRSASSGLREDRSVDAAAGKLTAAERALIFGHPGTLFDQLLEANAGGKIPTDYETLAKVVLGSDRDDVLFASSRSLQRAATSFAHPRHVATPTARLAEAAAFRAMSTNGRLFIGFAETTDQVEIISWNNREGRFDFELITGFAPGRTPKLSPADRKECEDCHQNGAPIFPRFAWRETNRSNGTTDPGDVDTAARMIEARQGDNQVNGVRIDKSVNPFEVDDAVRAGNRLVQVRRACAVACGGLAPAETSVCRAHLLKAALARKAKTTFGSYYIDKGTPKANAFYDGIDELGRLAARGWPADGFAYPSSVLLDRLPTDEPFPAPKEVGFWASLDEQKLDYDKQKRENTFDYRNNPDEYAVMNDLVAAGVDPLAADRLGTVGLALQKPHAMTTMPPEAAPDLKRIDPRTPRPLIGAIRAEDAGRVLADAAFECLGFLEIDDFVIDGALGAAREARLGKLIDEHRSELTSSWPPRREVVMEKVLGWVDQRSMTDHYTEALTQTAKTPAADAKAAGTGAASAPATVTNPLLAKYCSPCHNAEAVVYAPIPFADESALAGYVEAVATTRGKEATARLYVRKIESKQMPPEDAPVPIEAVDEASVRRGLVDELKRSVPSVFGP
jgi:hypothetical protein